MARYGPDRKVVREDEWLLYIGPFLFLLAVPSLFYAVGPIASLGVVAALIAILLSAEWLLPRVAEGTTAPKFEDASPPRHASRFLPLLYVPLQIGVLLWSAAIVHTLSLPQACAVVLSVGVTAGTFGMIAAHELVHSPNRYHRLAGVALLTCLSNRQFRISHLYVHHRLAATEQDAATARLGESFYAFLSRTVPQQWRQAWQFEARRCARHVLAPLRNRVAQDVVATLLVYLAVGWGTGMAGAETFLADSAVALIVLELFNYVAHYGLLRGTGPDGRREPLHARHSWNSSNFVCNLLVFNMGRHSDHHHRPSRFYEALGVMSDTPELPGGYVGSILLALVPPLWRRVMDPRVFDLRSPWTQEPVPAP
jgi:alkane 1-monooxygenase